MNDNWRIFVALGLTMLVLVGWNLLFPPQQIQEQSRNQTQSSPQQAEQKADSRSPTPEKPQPEADGALSSDAQAVFSAGGSKTLQVDTPLYTAVFSSQGGILKHFYLKNYKETIEPDSPPIDLVSKKTLAKAPMGLLWNRSPVWQNAEWSVQGQDVQLSGGESAQLVFRGEIHNGLEIVRTFTFQADSYAVDEDLKVRNAGDSYVSGVLSLTMASSGLVANESRYNTTSIAHYANQHLNKEDDKDDLGLGIASDNPVNWAGVDSNYFLLSVVPTSQDMFFKGKLEDSVYRVALEQNTGIEPGQSEQIAASYYLGPKEQKHLAQVGNNLIGALHYGWLNIIARPLVQVLKFFYTYVGNYGVAIILLTFVIKLIFWPLSHKSYKSMEKMKKIQPMMKELKEKYKDDRQKMNQELMQLYKTYKVNPAGGCLPMLLQIPVFIGLYEALLGAVELRHASFISHFPFTDIVWLADLSSKDPFYITPVVMGLSMFLQQKLSPTAGDPTQAKIMMIMPIFLTFIFLNFPAGLVVYFLTNNLLSIFQQWRLMRKA